MSTSHAEDPANAETIEASPEVAVAGAELQPGATIGRYTVVRRLGSGGMGVVYAARDSELAREVALKLLRGHKSGALEGRLQREAQAMARLAHDNVVRVFDVGSYGGHVFLAMELVDGTTVGEWLDAAPRSWREVVDVYRDAGRGLAEAHGAGIVHRDFKPSNVMIDRRGRVRVSDFGLARTAGAQASSGDDEVPSDERLTREGALVGTPRFMAPEQLAREDATAFSDQFAFAVSMFHGASGVYPFAGTTPPQLLETIRAGKLAPAKLPSWLRRVLARALAADPQARFPSMTALVAALDRGRKRPARVALVAAAVALAGAGAGVAFAVSGQSRGATCQRAGDKVAAAWSPEQRAQVIAKLPALRPGFGAQTAARVTGKLDSYANVLAADRIGACRVATDEVPGTFDAQCLDAQLRSLATVAQAFDAASATTVDRADDIVAQLVRCDHHAAAQIDPPKPAQRVPVELAEDALAAVAVRAARGEFAGALAEAKPVVAQARSIGYPPLLARALSRTGSLEAKLNDPQAAADLREATEVAARAHDDRAGFAAWSTLLLLAAADPDHPDKLEATLVGAQAAAARTGEDADPAQIELYRGEAELTANKLAEGERSCKHAYDVQSKLYGSNALELRGTIHCLATAYTARGEYAGAKEWLDRAFAIDRDTLGADHPDTAEDLGALADLQLRTGHFEEGLATSNKALAILERTYGKSSDQVSETLLTMGNLLVDSGHPADAEPKLRRSLAIAEQIHGGESQRAASAMAGVGMSLSDQHHYKEARALLEHAIAIDDKVGATASLGITLINLTDLTLTEKKWDEALALAKRAETALVAGMGADSSIVGFALFDQARALNELHRYGEAIPLAEHAMAIAKTGDDPDNLASFQLALAMALGGANRDLPRAIELARTAHATFVKIGHTAGSDEAREMAAAFLRAHGAKP